MMLHYLLLGLTLASFATQAEVVCLEDPYDKQKCYIIDSEGEVFSSITAPYITKIQSPLTTNNTHSLAKINNYQTTLSINQQLQAYINKYRLVLAIMLISLVIVIIMHFLTKKPTN